MDFRTDADLKAAQALDLYSSVGWKTYTEKPEDLMAALKGSHFLITAWDQGVLVGLARCISDGVSIAYLQDILVRPDRQGRGVGRRLLQACLDRYEGVRQLVLLTDNRPEQLAFYTRIGLSNTRDLTDNPLNAFVRIEGVELS